MARVISVKVYSYLELSDDAKDNAIFWFRTTDEYQKRKSPAYMVLPKLPYWYLVDGTNIAETLFESSQPCY
jgi:hypothetical protein